MMETSALLVATVALAVLMALAAYHDLRSLRIPNWLVLGVIVVYAVTGLWGMPLASFAWHLLWGAIVLVVGFGLYAIGGGQVGGGDIKLIAALTPFIAGRDLPFVLVLFAVLSLAGILLHRFARAIIRERKTGWAALDQQRFFPVGLLLGATMIIYLGNELAGRYMA